MSPRLPRLHRRGNEAAGHRPPREPLRGAVTRLTVHLGESDQYRHRPLYTEIVHRAHRAGLAGASVLRGIEGFGAGSLIHTTRLLDLAEDLPVLVVVIDTDERIQSFLPELGEIAADRLTTLERLEAVTPVPHDTRPDDAQPHDAEPHDEEEAR
jgi:uncharacterized protein